MRDLDEAELYLASGDRYLMKRGLYPTKRGLYWTNPESDAIFGRARPSVTFRRLTLTLLSLTRRSRGLQPARDDPEHTRRSPGLSTSRKKLTRQSR